MPPETVIANYITKRTIVKYIVVHIGGNDLSLVLPHSDALVETILDAQLIKLAFASYTHKDVTFKLQNGQIRVEVINDSALDYSDIIAKEEGKRNRASDRDELVS